MPLRCELSVGITETRQIERIGLASLNGFVGVVDPQDAVVAGSHSFNQERQYECREHIHDARRRQLHQVTPISLGPTLALVSYKQMSRGIDFSLQDSGG